MVHLVMVTFLGPFVFREESPSIRNEIWNDCVRAPSPIPLVRQYRLLSFRPLCLLGFVHYSVPVSSVSLFCAWSTCLSLLNVVFNFFLFSRVTQIAEFLESHRTVDDGLAPGRIQREKKRSYKDLLQEEDEIATQVETLREKVQGVRTCIKVVMGWNGFLVLFKNYFYLEMHVEDSKSS